MAKTHNTHPFPTISPLVQRLFIFFSLLVYVAQLAMAYEIGRFLLTVRAGELQLSPALFMVVETTLLPAVLFAIAYFLLPKAKPHLSRIFQGVMATVMGYLLYTIVAELMTLIMGGLRITMPASYAVLPQIVLLAVVFSGYAYGLVHLRRIGSAAIYRTRLQQFMVGLAAGATVTVIGEIAYRVAEQYPYNQNLSGFLPMTLETLFPVVLFIVAYLFSSKKQSRLARYFRSAIYALSGMMLYLATSALVRYLVAGNSGGSWNYPPELLLMAMVTVVYLAVLVIFRRRLQ